MQRSKAVKDYIFMSRQHEARLVDLEKYEKLHSVKVAALSRTAVKLPLLMLVTACAAGSGADTVNILTYLQTKYPGTTVLTANEIDSRSCGPVASDSEFGIVSRDFDGDGLVDHAALLWGRREQYIHEGHSYDVHRVTFTIVLSKPNGYAVVWETSSLQSAPISVAIEPASVSASLPIGQKEHLENPPLIEIHAATDEGVTFSYCEKSSRLYFWDGERIVEYSLSD